MSESEPRSDDRFSGDPTVVDARAAVERRDDAPDRCTIYEVLEPERIRTAWISAAEGSFVSREDAR